LTGTFPSDHNPIAITIDMPGIEIAEYQRESPIHIQRYKTKGLKPEEIRTRWANTTISSDLPDPNHIHTTKELDDITILFTQKAQAAAETAFGLTQPPRKQKPQYLNDAALKILCNDRQALHKLYRETQKGIHEGQIDEIKRAELQTLLTSLGEEDTSNLNTSIKRCTKKLQRQIKSRINNLQTNAIKEAIQRNHKAARDNVSYLLDKVMDESNRTFLPAVHPTTADEDGQIQSDLGYTTTSPTDRNNAIWEYGRQLHDNYKPLPSTRPEWAATTETPLNDVDTLANLTGIVTETEIGEAIKEASANTSPGPDKINNEILKALNGTDRKWLASLLTKCMELNHLPSEWENAHMRLLHKGGDPMDLTNYRGISLLPCTYKLYSSILQKRLRKTLETHNLISDLQSGFRNERGCHLNLNTLINCIEHAQTTNASLHLLYIDIVKAFDSLQHEAIAEALAYHRIPQPFINIIMSLYKNCTSQIITGNTITNPFPIRRGVRQGDTLSPLLFILVIDILLNNIEKQNSGYQLQNVKIPAQALADDITILTNDAEQMEHAWNIICQWSERYSLLINTKPGKTMYTNRRDTDRNANLSFRNKTVQPKSAAENYKYLGVWINLNLDWARQESESVSTLTWLCSKIRYRKLPLQTKIYIINTVIAPSIAYRMWFAQYQETTLKRMQQILTTTIAIHARTPKKIHKSKLTASHNAGALQVVDFHHLHITAYTATFLDFRLNPNASTTSTKSSEDIHHASYILPLLREGFHPPKWESKKTILFEPCNSITKFARFLKHLNWKCTANYTSNTKAIQIMGRYQYTHQAAANKANKLAEAGVIDVTPQTEQTLRSRWNKEISNAYDQLKSKLEEQITQNPHNAPRQNIPRITRPLDSPINPNLTQQYIDHTIGRTYT
jgi:hypothetical protein